MLSHLRLLLFFLLPVLASCSSLDPPPEEEATSRLEYPFVDVAVDLGLNQFHTGGSPEKGYIVEAKGGGATFLDFDDDGDLDIYWVNGAPLEFPAEGGGNILYRNDGDRGFADVTADLHVEGRGWGMGAISADYDNDGDADLFVTTLQGNILYRNDRDQGFVDRTEQAGLASSQWSTGAACADYDNDGDLDLYVANYLEFHREEIQKLGTQWKGVDVFIGPVSLPPLADALYRNEDDGRFVPITASVGLEQSEPGYGFGVLFADFDRDGDPDLYVANDSSPNFLYRNEGNSRFTDISFTANVAFGEMGTSQAGMGVAWGDYDGNGYPDILVTNFEDDYNTLYRNNGDGYFSDVSFDVGLGKASLRYVSFGAGFLDYNNDGHLDILVANGHVYPQIEQAGTATTYGQPNHLFENLGDGSFELRMPQSSDSTNGAQVSRGSIIGDYDNDGDLDVFISNMNDRPAMLRNDVGNRQNWLGIKLIGTTSNRDGIGAQVRLVAGNRAQIRDVICGSSFLCSEDRRGHFGLGNILLVDSLEVRWPSGVVQRLVNLPVNRYMVIEEDQLRWSLQGQLSRNKEL